jgi:predicted XRE-type DNA-binding protein
MADKRRRAGDTEFEKSEGNVFADLGLAEADVLHIKAEVAASVLELAKKRGAKTQRQIADLLGIAQSDISNLNTGKLKDFSLERLLLLLVKLEQRVEIKAKTADVGRRPGFEFRLAA